MLKHFPCKCYCCRNVKEKWLCSTVQSLIRDGIARGTSITVSLGDERDNLVMLNDQSTAHYSFSKGTAATNYPSSLMGSVALLRQTY
jgi:hypothetical protein